MIKDFFIRLLQRRHYWRYVSFSEVAELYSSRFLRLIGMNVAAGFASVYLYQTGYSLVFLASFWAIYFAFKMFILRPAAMYTAYFGPKHGILLSNLVFIPAMIALGFLEQFGIWAIAVWGLSLAVSTSLYVTCYLVDFSKVKSIEHAGKELGYMNIFEKLATGLSPIIGGLVALFFGPQTVMFVGAFVFLISAMPLFRTGEQMSLRQKLDFSGFPWKVAIRNLYSKIGMGIDYIGTITAWSLFIVIVIFPNFGDEIYVTLGSLSAVSILAAILTSYVYGKIIDKNSGAYLLRYSVVLNSLLHVARPFVATPASVVAVNVANEISTTGVQMPYMKGMFDAADASGNRVVYVYLAELMTNFGGVLGSAALLVCVLLFGETGGLTTFFFVVAIGSLLTGTANFKVYRK